MLFRSGFEGHVLRGLKKTIEAGQPDIIFEYNADTRRHNPDILSEIQDILGPAYVYYGLKRSREFPSLETMSPNRKYENILATVNPHSGRL